MTARLSSASCTQTNRTDKKPPFCGRGLLFAFSSPSQRPGPSIYTLPSHITVQANTLRRCAWLAPRGTARCECTHAQQTPAAGLSPLCCRPCLSFTIASAVPPACLDALMLPEGAWRMPLCSSPGASRSQLSRLHAAAASKNTHELSERCSARARLCTVSCTLTVTTRAGQPAACLPLHARSPRWVRLYRHRRMRGAAVFLRLCIAPALSPPPLLATRMPVRQACAPPLSLLLLPALASCAPASCARRQFL